MLVVFFAIDTCANGHVLLKPFMASPWNRGHSAHTVLLGHLKFRTSMISKLILTPVIIDAIKPLCHFMLPTLKRNLAKLPSPYVEYDLWGLETGFNGHYLDFAKVLLQYHIWCVFARHTCRAPPIANSSHKSKIQNQSLSFKPFDLQEQ